MRLKAWEKQRLETKKPIVFMKLKNLLSELTKNFTLLPKQKDDFSFQKSRPVLHSISKSPKMSHYVECVNSKNWT